MHGQNVGINTDGSSPDASAILDLKASDRGLLIPRVSLTNVNNPSPVSPPVATGLLVYNTNPSVTGGSGTGFYYWNGSQWIRLDNSNGDWRLTGNAGTSPASNFLGTTDAQPLVIRTNNTERMRVATTGNVGIGISNPTERLTIAGNIGIQASVGSFVGTLDNYRLELRVNNQPTLVLNAPGSGMINPDWSIHRGGGDQRGLHAVDLQSARSSSSQVASGQYSVIVGGQNNTVNNIYGAILGGYQNSVSTMYSVVAGGNQNSISGAAGLGYSFIGGGNGNSVTHNIAVVVGGSGNQANNGAAFIGGGSGNIANGHTTVICGGIGNQANGNWSVVGGGQTNRAEGIYSTVSGGAANHAVGAYSAIAGGYYLRVGDRSFGFSGQTAITETNLTSFSNIAAFVDVDLWLYNRDNTARQLRFYVPTTNNLGAANYTAFRAATSQSANIIYTLPSSLTPSSSVASGVLQSDASGNLSWVSPTALVGVNSWSISGNSGTNPTSNFLGTIDNQPLIIRTFNIERMRISSSGNVGIGVSTPIAPLHVGVTARFDDNVTLGDAPSDQLSINAGTVTLPNIPTGLTTDAILLRDPGTNSVRLMGPTAFISAHAWSLTGNTVSGINFIGTNNAQPLRFRTDGTDRMIITETGFVGINDNSPNERLIVGGNIGLRSGNPTFVGTLDNQRLELRVANQPSLILNQSGTSAPAWSIQRDLAGNTRGLHAIDLQMSRNLPTQVASGDYSVISGGDCNRASGSYSTTSGGRLNSANADYTVVCGGRNNTVNGEYSCIVGGHSNSTNAAYVMIYGENVQVTSPETHRVYFFGDGVNFNPSGFLVINRLDGDYPIHVGTNASNGNGAYLSAGGVWTNASSRLKKERFLKLNESEILEKIKSLPVEGWYYKGTNEFHIGPYAEDFYEHFGTGDLDNLQSRSYLASSDVAGVGLLGIKALANKVDMYEQKLKELQAYQEKVKELQERIRELENLLKTLNK
ncbi:MAG: hypothetical protein NZ480_01895 [Bdellovibrionaceae bacterium]|nr:hypothetical protein [Pseudobdellovibrionaceae bacterium]